MYRAAMTPAVSVHPILSCTHPQRPYRRNTLTVGDVPRVDASVLCRMRPGLRACAVSQF